MKPIKLLVNGHQIAEFHRFIPHVDNGGVHSFGLRLKELNITTNPCRPPEIRPGYNEMLTFGVHGGYLLIAVYMFGLAVEFMFMERWPFFHVSVYKAEINYVDDDDPE